MGNESSRLRSAPLLPAALTVLMIVAAVLAAGFLGEFSADPVVDGTAAPTVRESTAAPTATADPEPQADYGERLGIDAGATVALALVLLMAAAALLIRFLLRLRVRGRSEHPGPVPSDVRDGDTAEATPEALARWSRESELALGSGSDTSDAVIRCWLDLEHLCAAVGTPRRPVQTTSDFAAAIAHGLDLPSQPLAVLTGLYQRARFGGAGDPQRLTPTDHAAALSAVRSLSAAVARREPGPPRRPPAGRPG